MTVGIHEKNLLEDRQILNERIATIQQFIEIQKNDGNWNYDSYQLGLTNGLILAYAILEDEEPTFLSRPEEWLVDKKVEEEPVPSNEQDVLHS